MNFTCILYLLSLHVYPLSVFFLFFFFFMEIRAASQPNKSTKEKKCIYLYSYFFSCLCMKENYFIKLLFLLLYCFEILYAVSDQSNRKTMNRNWCNQKANPAPKTKTGNK